MYLCDQIANQDLNNSMSAAVTTAMLPPKLPASSLHHNQTYHPMNTENTLSDDEHSVSKHESGPNLGGNLNEDSMMVLSQSIDSIHTIGTNNGVDGIEHQVRTLFVSGLPLDAKPRELYLLFRGFKGYLSSTLKPAGKNGKLTAPVGFVTFELRDHAEEAMAKLQGVKFDPEGNQHLRLEFARSNTKVTKPKTMLPSNGFLNHAQLSGSQSTNPQSLSGLNSPHLATVVSLNGCCPANFVPTSLSRMITNLQGPIFSPIQLAGSALDHGGGNIFVPPADANTAAAAAAAAAAAVPTAQWAPIPGLSNMVSAYDSAAYLSSAAGLLQGIGFRALIPGNINSTNFNIPSTVPSLQMVQAAIAHANVAAAALNSMNSSNVTGCGSLTSPIQTVGQSQMNQSTSSSSSGSSPATSSALSCNVTGTNFQSIQHQSQINSFVAQFQQHQQQQQQALATIQLNQHAGSNPLAQSLGFTPQLTGIPGQLNATTIGLIGGYNSIIKELTATEQQQQHPHIHTPQSQRFQQQAGLSCYHPQPNINF